MGHVSFSNLCFVMIFVMIFMSLLNLGPDFTRDFVMGPLRSVKTKFIVVTHNSAYSVPRHVQDQELLKHPLLIRWFAQNVSPGYSDHEKMEAVPLGLDNPRVRGYLISDIEPYLRAAPPAYRDRLKGSPQVW